jgi:O-antigen/teichoic acid export membrane protein
MCVLAVRGNLNIVLTKWLAGPESTSYFGLAHRVGAVVTMVAGAALTALYPRICGAGAGSRDAMRRGVNLLLTWIVLAYFAVFIALTLPSNEIIRVLFGPKFGPAGSVLALMAIFPMLSVIDILYGMTFIALSRIWTYLVIMVIATIVNLGASLILIPRLADGGAAIAAVLSSLVMVALGAHQLARALEGPVLWNVLLWPGVCFVVGVGCALPIRQPILAAAAGLIAMGIAALALRNELHLNRAALEAIVFRQSAGS